MKNLCLYMEAKRKYVTKIIRVWYVNRGKIYSPLLNLELTNL